MRVLVIDDNRDCADSQAALVRAWGHDARVAYDGACALEIAHEYCPDVMLVDIGLPDMDGCELAEKIRGVPVLENTKLLAISGYTDIAVRQRARDAGFDDYLIKPTDLRALEERLRCWCQEQADASLLSL
jgi:two-component system CheB/CheR fusion protein